MGDTGKKELGYWEVTALGIGGMVGGGIFAVLGLTVDLTRGAAPLAFFLAGIVALVTSYSMLGFLSHFRARAAPSRFWTGLSARGC